MENIIFVNQERRCLPTVNHAQIVLKFFNLQKSTTKKGGGCMTTLANVVPFPVVLPIGRKAIMGALARMCRSSNNPDSSSRDEFGDWDDWENGHDNDYSDSGH
jgi:hypothetical protein